MTPQHNHPATLCGAVLTALGITLLAHFGKYAEDLTLFCTDTMPRIIAAARDTAALTGLETACNREAACMDALAAMLTPAEMPGEEDTPAEGMAATTPEPACVTPQTVETAETLPQTENETAPAEPAPADIAAAEQDTPDQDGTAEDPPAEIAAAEKDEIDALLPDDFTPLILEPRGREEAEEAVAKLPVKCKIIMAGDSMMESFGPVFYNHMKHRRGLEFVLTARYSTGLCRPEYFNWPKNFSMVADETQPDIAIFYIGANDAMPIKVEKGSVYAGNANWAPAYRNKVNEMLDLADSRHITSLWLGLPVMGDKYAQLLHETTMAAKEAVQKRGVPFLDVEPILADEEGGFQFYGLNIEGKKERLRTNDKCHITDAGNKVLIREFMPMFEQALLRHKLQHPELCIEGPLEEKSYSAPFKSILKFKPGQRKK